MIRSPHLRLIASLLLLTAVCRAEPEYPQVFRTFMPEAGPSAFGVVLSPELALCYDSLRGGVNQMWQGTLDLSPTLQAKINKPAAISGWVFYKESTVQPVRLDPDKMPERRFKGYRYEKDAVTFEYTLDGVLVSETIRAIEDGRGIERVWKTEGEESVCFLTEPQLHATLTFKTGRKQAAGSSGGRIERKTEAPTVVLRILPRDTK
jgi:hypothetical protein